MVGFSSSVTVIVKTQSEVLPTESVATYVTVVVPTANVSHGAWSPEMVELQLSVVVGSVQVTTALQLPASFV